MPHSSPELRRQDTPDDQNRRVGPGPCKSLVRVQTNTRVKVSVVIPTYNYGRFITEAVESVRAQTVSDIQIIVVDDGSTDDTPEIISRINDPRLEVVRIPNGGVSAARNAGLALARGEFIAFLDADDRWTPQLLERQLSVLAAEPDAVAVFTNFVRFDESDVYPDQFTFYPELARTPTRPTGDGTGELILGNAFCALISFVEIPAWVQTVLFRASAVRDLRFPVDGAVPGLRYGLCEDMHFCLRGFRRGSVAFLSEPLVQVRRHGDNATSRIADLPFAQLAALSLLANEHLSREERIAHKRRLGRALIDAGIQNAVDGHLSAAARAYTRALTFAGARLSAVKNLVLLVMPKVAGT